jgi:preprotein translocase subunit YajC
MAAPGGQSSPAGAGQLATLLLPIALTVVVFYLLLLRPETKRQRRHQEMVQRLKKGDRVVTTGGILGRISDLSEDTVTIDVGNRVKIEVLRSAIRDVVTGKAGTTS